MQRSRARAADQATALENASWEPFERLSHMSAERVPHAQALVETVKDLLTRDEHVALAGQGVKRGTVSGVQDVDRRGRAGCSSGASCAVALPHPRCPRWHSPARRTPSGVLASRTPRPCSTLSPGLWRQIPSLFWILTGICTRRMRVPHDHRTYTSTGGRASGDGSPPEARRQGHWDAYARGLAGWGNAASRWGDLQRCLL